MGEKSETGSQKRAGEVQAKTDVFFQELKLHLDHPHQSSWHLPLPAPCLCQPQDRIQRKGQGSPCGRIKTEAGLGSII